MNSVNRDFSVQLHQRSFKACVAVIYITALLVFFLASCGKEEEKPPEIIRSIKWMRVTATNAKQVRMISGIVKAVDETYLSFPVSGTVEKVNARLGDRVKKNDVLGELDKQPFLLAVRNAEAKLKQSQANVVERRANYDRVNTLYETNNTSKAELDKARAEFDSAKSQVKASKAQLGLAIRDLNKTMLRAPFNGVISMRDVEPFVEVSAGKTVFGLDGEEAGFEVSVGAPETLVLNLATGQATEVFFPTLDNRKAPGMITEVGSRSDQANTYPVTVRLQEQFSELRSGMTVEVQFEYFPEGGTGKQVLTGFTVPITAVLPAKDEQYFVFVYDEKTSSVKKTAINIGNIRGNEVIVQSGIKANDIIATAGVQFLEDQQKVTLMQKGQ